MSARILTSNFDKNFPIDFVNRINEIVIKRNNFAFVASDFYNHHEKTDKYFNFYLNMFISNKINFNNAYVVDGRMTKQEAQQAISKADVVWLAGGNTPLQYKCLEEYDLIYPIQSNNGVIIGMSAGAINMGKVAICSVTAEGGEKQIYKGLGVVSISVEPHYNKRGISDELSKISHEYCIYGLCDEGAIIFVDDNIEIIGNVFLINKGEAKQIS
ncbi:MAG: Type 1 glutamine amidotransferase-like domain-containing protein [Clostridia bacterium]